MIRECKKPGIFQDLKDNLYYIEGYDENGIYAYMGFDVIGTNAILHLEMVKFSHIIMKNILNDWKIIKQTLKNAGITTICASRVGKIEDYDHWIRFVKKFGFDIVYQHVTVTQEL